MIIKNVNTYGLDLVQLHGNESAKYCKSLYESGVSIIKAFGVSNSFDFMTLNEYSEVCDFFLFDTKTGNGGGSG